MKNNKTRTLCEAAIFIAMAEILSFIKLYEFPNGGSVTLEMLPIILFAVRSLEPDPGNAGVGMRS